MSDFTYFKNKLVLELKMKQNTIRQQKQGTT